jgi:hypothetical protein
MRSTWQRWSMEAVLGGAGVGALGKLAAFDLDGDLLGVLQGKLTGLVAGRVLAGPHAAGTAQRRDLHQGQEPASSLHLDGAG